jgi:nucleoside triphosphate pyrophosphatase
VRLILASASPRRRELLERLGLPFEVRPSGIEEPLAAGVPASTLATTLARAKAADIADRLRAAGEAALVLGADTLVVLDGQPLGKPTSQGDARAMLRALRGRSHEVVTAVVVRDADPAGRELTEAVVSRVLMRDYTDDEIAAYVATGESDDKAGAYAVQGRGGRLVGRVDGCYTNVVGLPLRTTARLLQAFGLTPASI